MDQMMGVRKLVFEKQWELKHICEAHKSNSYVGLIWNTKPSNFINQWQDLKRLTETELRVKWIHLLSKHKANVLEH